MSDKFEFNQELNCIRVRLGANAFYCRGADIILGFENYGSASIFESAHHNHYSPIEKIFPAFLEDLEVFAYGSGMALVFETDVADGKIYMALPQWCCSENNLLGVANEISCGWGIENSYILSFGN